MLCVSLSDGSAFNASQINDQLSGWIEPFGTQVCVKNQKDNNTETDQIQKNNNKGFKRSKEKQVLR